MTLTIPDVEKWDPGKLTTASTAINKLYGDVDATVQNGTTKIEGLQWDGTAAAAARTRMELEKTRASAVSQALMGLGTAFNQWVGHLNEVKAAVLARRDDANRAPAPPSIAPPFEAAPNGTVSAQPQLDWYGQHRGKMSDADFTKLTIGIKADAAGREHKLVLALKAAEDTAANAVKAVNDAKAKVDAAYNGLGDPTLGTAAAPGKTSPASTAPPSTPHYQSTSYSGNGSHQSNDGSSYSGASLHNSGGAPTTKPSGDVAEWIKQAREILIQEGVPPDKIDDNALATIIQHESGGDPNAINNWDSNAAAGHPSKGLMQCIDGTFNRWAVPGHTDIWNPVDNIVACTRYSIDRYGSLDNVPGVAAVADNEGYVGY